MTVKILGTGCANCKRLEANTREAVSRLGVEADVEKVEDINDIVAMGVMRTPGLVVGERVVLSGRVPEVPELVSLLADAM